MDGNINPERSCVTCAFSRWEPQTKTLACHRWPPRPVIVWSTEKIPTEITDFARVLPDDWCGEYQPPRKDALVRNLSRSEVT